MTEILSFQPLEPFADSYLQVTITEYNYVDGDDTPEEIGTTFVMVDGAGTRKWLDGIKDFHRKVEFVPIQVFSGPKVVHALDTTPGKERTVCDISEQRKVKYGQSIDQAFVRVVEDVSCGRCKRWLKQDVSFYQGVVLRPWDWNNVPEDYRPGGKKHRYNKPSYGRAGK